MMDPMTMTCADLMAMDMDGMMKAGTVLKEAMKDDAKMMAMTDEEVMKAAEEACKMHGDGTVMDAVKM
jgi:DNA polymerase III alpha subunit